MQPQPHLPIYIVIRILCNHQGRGEHWSWFKAYHYARHQQREQQKNLDPHGRAILDDTHKGTEAASTIQR